MLKQAFALKQFFSWKDLLGNARAMKRARSPLRGFVTTICIWSLVDIGLWERITDGAPISLQEFAAAKHLELPILRSVCRYLTRLSYLVSDGDQVYLSKKGRRFWEQVPVWTGTSPTGMFDTSDCAAWSSEASAGRLLIWSVYALTPSSA